MVCHDVHIWVTFCFRSTVYGVSWCTHLVDFLFQSTVYMVYHDVHIWLTFCFRSTVYGVSWCTHLVDFLFQKRRIMAYTFNWLFV